MEAPAPLLRLTAASRRFGDHVALAPTDLALAAGEGLCLVGQNGAGKSTLLRLAAGAALPTDGAVSVAGMDPFEAHAIRARIGYLGHESVLEARETVAEHVAWYRRIRGGGGPSDDGLRDALGLEAVWDELVGGLSRGLTRRTELACVLAGGPDLLVLDEPLGGLDEARRSGVAAAMRRLAPGAAVLAASHLPGELEPMCPTRREIVAGVLGPPTSAENPAGAGLLAKSGPPDKAASPTGEGPIPGA